MKNLLNKLLIIFFILTLMAPITGVIIHKMVSLLFLVLALVHTVINWNKMNIKRLFLLGIIILTFVSGVLGMIFKEYSIIMSLHTLMSIITVFFLAIHIFVFSSKLCKNK